MITGLLSRGKLDPIFRMLVDQFDFDKPDTGIAFTMPIEKLSY